MKRSVGQKASVVVVALSMLVGGFAGASPARADDASAWNCVAAAAAFAGTINFCSQTATCIAAAIGTGGGLGLACIGAGIGCMAAIGTAGVQGPQCMEWLHEQARLTCEADGGFAVWDNYSRTYLCQPQFEGLPPGWEQGPLTETPDPSGGSGGGPGGWGWGYTTPSGSIGLWACYTICDNIAVVNGQETCLSTVRICHPI
jgi:hypothetical protein